MSSHESSFRSGCHPEPGDTKSPPLQASKAVPLETRSVEDFAGMVGEAIEGRNRPDFLRFSLVVVVYGSNKIKKWTLVGSPCHAAR